MITPAKSAEKVRCDKCKKIYQAWAYDDHRCRPPKPKRKCRYCHNPVSVKKYAVHINEKCPARIARCSCGAIFLKDEYNWCPKCRRIGEKKRPHLPLVQGGLTSLGK